MVVPIGAALLNEGPQVEQFFQIARASVENLLEVDDYAVAEALFALGYLRYGQVPSHPHPNRAILPE